MGLQGHRHELEVGGLILRGCLAHACQTLIIFIAQIVSNFSMSVIFATANQVVGARELTLGTNGGVPNSGASGIFLVGVVLHNQAVQPEQKAWV